MLEGKGLNPGIFILHLFIKFIILRNAHECGQECTCTDDVKLNDISVGSCCGIKYVLQARRSKDGKIQMRLEKLMGAYDTVAHPTLEQLELVTFKSE